MHRACKASPGASTLQATMEVDVTNQLAISDAATTPQGDAASRRSDTTSRAGDASPAKAWYADPSLIISVVGLAFTVSISTISTLRDKAQDINAEKDALHAIFQQYENSVSQSLDVNKTEDGKLLDLGFDFN